MNQYRDKIQPMLKYWKIHVYNWLMWSFLWAVTERINNKKTIVTTSHQCYSSCTGCRSISESCSRLRGLYIIHSFDRLACTSPMTAGYFRTLVVAHCDPIPIICESCPCWDRNFLAAGLWNDLPLGLQQPGLSFDFFRQSLYLASEVLLNLWSLY